MYNILLTGSSGFIGSRLNEILKKKKFKVKNFNSYDNYKKYDENIKFNSREIKSNTNWHESFKNIDCVIHCAGISEIKKNYQNNLELFKVINVDLTIDLAEQASLNGVKRFIFLSSIKVNGEKTKKNSPFKFDDNPSPKDAYAISKWNAEKSLKEISKKTGLEIVIIRPPLVYGPGVKGNFLNILQLAKLGIPLPLGKIENYRSFLALDNLVDLIICCIAHPRAAGKTFLASDCDDISFKDLLKVLSNLMNKNVYLFSFPICLLKLIFFIIGKSSQMDRLFNSLQVDTSHTCQELRWKPKKTMSLELKKTAEWYLKR